MASILEEDEPQEPSVEELLLDLEQELSKICPYTCPNKVRILLGKIAYKVHKEKDPGQFLLCITKTNVFADNFPFISVDRSLLLNAISEDADLLKSLLKLIEVRTQRLKITKNVTFEFSIFDLLKLTSLVTLFDRKSCHNWPFFDIF